MVFLVAFMVISGRYKRFTEGRFTFTVLEILENISIEKFLDVAKTDR